MAQRRAKMSQAPQSDNASAAAPAPSPAPSAVPPAAAAAATVAGVAGGGGGDAKSAAPEGLRLIVFGATGAVGGACVAEAATRREVSAVTAVVRRAGAFQMPTDASAAAVAARAKVTERVIDFKALKADDFKAADGTAHDGLFLCLGADFGAAGSNALDEVAKIGALSLDVARAAALAGVRHASLVSGAAVSETRTNERLRASLAREQSLGAMGFESAAVYRPGIFDAERGAKSRGSERCMVCCASYVCCLCFACCCPRFTPIRMNTIALAMVNTFVSPHKQKYMVFDGSNGIEQAVANPKVAPANAGMKRN